MPRLIARALSGVAGLAIGLGLAGADAAVWSGWYAGVHGNYAFGRPQVDLDRGDLTAPGANFNLATIAPEINFTWKGWMGGGQLGHNWQTGAHTLLGFELSASLGKIGGSKTVITNVPGFVPFTNSVSSKLDYVATARLRAGLLLGQSALLYVTGGGAGAHAKASRNTEFGGALGPNGAASQRRFGWTLGGGAEIAIGAHARLRAEYLHVDLSDGKFSTVYPATGAVIRARAENALDLLTAGLSFAY